MSTRASLILALLIALLPPVCGVMAFESGKSQGHEQAQCSQCHSFDRDPGGSGYAAMNVDAACISCHAMGSGSTVDRLGFHGQAGRRCTECHVFHEPTQMVTRVGKGLLPTTFSDSEGHCAACHSMDGDLSQISMGHREAAQLYHSGELNLELLSPSDACLACHSSSSNALPSDLIPMDTPRFTEHASHSYGVAMLPGGEDPVLRIRNVLDPRIRLYDQQIECATCHRLTSQDEDLLVVFEQRYGLCQGCHEHGTDSSSMEMLAAK